MDNDLGKQLENFLKQQELESLDKLKFIQKSYLKKEIGRTLTYEIEGQNELRIRTGEVGKSSESIELNFESDSHRKDYLDKEVKSLIGKGYRKTEQDDLVLLFVQLHPPENHTLFDDVTDIFEKFREFQILFDTPIYDKHLGYYAASDLGKGFNMLYNVWDEEKALKAIIDVSRFNRIDKQTIIAKRIYNTPNDWYYQVLFPRNLEGNFNPN